jgi:hypothetical protein
MVRCPECGLPVRACNAIRMYRRAAVLLREGRLVQARDLLNEADSEFERWQQEARDD